MKFGLITLLISMSFLSSATFFASTEDQEKTIKFDTTPFEIFSQYGIINLVFQDSGALSFTQVPRKSGEIIYYPISTGELAFYKAFGSNITPHTYEKDNLSWGASFLRPDRLLPKSMIEKIKKVIYLKDYKENDDEAWLAILFTDGSLRIFSMKSKTEISEEHFLPDGYDRQKFRDIGQQEVSNIDYYSTGSIFLLDKLAFTNFVGITSEGRIVIIKKNCSYQISDVFNYKFERKAEFNFSVVNPKLPNGLDFIIPHAETLTLTESQSHSPGGALSANGKLLAIWTYPKEEQPSGFYGKSLGLTTGVEWASQKTQVKLLNIPESVSNKRFAKIYSDSQSTYALTKEGVLLFYNYASDSLALFNRTPIENVQDFTVPTSYDYPKMAIFYKDYTLKIGSYRKGLSRGRNFVREHDPLLEKKAHLPLKPDPILPPRQRTRSVGELENLFRIQ